MANRANRLAYEAEQRRYNFIRIWNKRYYHMKARHEGKSTNYSHSNGKGILTKEEFMAWCKEYDNMITFITLYMEWAESKFSLCLSPSIDRIDPRKGYVAGNLQWLTFSDNCEKNNKYVDPITKKMVRSK